MSDLENIGGLLADARQLGVTSRKKPGVASNSIETVYGTGYRYRV